MLKVRDLTLHIGGLQILDHLSFDVPQGSITGLIGPNGAGKSSFFNALFNLFLPQKGSIRLEGVELVGKRPDQVHRLGVSRTFQDSKPLPQITVMENLLSACPYSSPVSLRRVFLGSRLLREEEAAHRRKARELLKKVGLEGKEHTLAKNLSYGQTKLVEILKLFLHENRLALLDEPFSGLFPEMIKVISGLVRELVQSGRTVMLVEHNMKLIAETCDHVVVMDAGRKLAEGSFEAVRKNPEVIEAYLGD